MGRGRWWRACRRDENPGPCILPPPITVPPSPASAPDPRPTRSQPPASPRFPAPPPVPAGPATARHRHWLLPRRSRLLEELTLGRAGRVRVHEFVHRLAKTWLLDLHDPGSPSGSGPWTPRRLPGAPAQLRLTGGSGRSASLSSHRAASSGPPRTTGETNRQRSSILASDARRRDRA